MSYPILYSATETKFDHNGIGILSDCAFCEVTEEANGTYELRMEYPAYGIHAKAMSDRSIIKANAGKFRGWQLFRVYSVVKKISGILTISAQHISYDLSGIPVSPFSATNAVFAFSKLSSNAVLDCPFNFWTDITSFEKFELARPASIRSCIGGIEGSFLDVYGGELEFDNYSVKLHGQRGANRGVSIRYGKNLTDLQQERNIASVITGVYPYWVDTESGEIAELNDKIVRADGDYDFESIAVLDLSSEFMDKPSEQQLMMAAKDYMDKNKVGEPAVSLTVSFAQLDGAVVELFDTVNVEFPMLGVSSSAKVVKTVYDSLEDELVSVSVGSVRESLSDTVVRQEKEIEKTPKKNELQKLKETATAWLTNGKGYAYFRKDDLGNIVDILFMDTQDIETAVNVMRVGQSGIGFSHSGVNGPYESAWTIDGVFNASFVGAGILYGLLIKSGKIESEDGTISIDLNNNFLSISSATENPKQAQSILINQYGIHGYGYDHDIDGLNRFLQLSPGHVFEEGGGAASVLKSENPLGFLIAAGLERGYVDLSPYGTLKIRGRKVYWRDNGDGTATLVGEL